MDGMNKKDRSGLPPTPPPPPPPQPPRSRAHPSTLPSSFLEGFSHSIVPHYQSQNPQNHPLISGSGGSDVSLRTEPVTVLADATGDPQPDQNFDDRRLRRLLSNRISAQKSRLRRINYINEMETQVKEFEAQLAQLTPEMILTQRKKKLLQMENELMKQKKLTLKERINLKNAETEAYRTELYHLRHLFQLQQQQKKEWMAAWASVRDDYITDQGMYQGRLQAQNLYDQTWPRQQQFANPNMSQPSGSDQMEKLGISMTDHRDQIAASEACNRLGQEGMAHRNFQTGE